MNKKLAILGTFATVVVLVLILPLIVGLIVGKGSDKNTQQIKPGDKIPVKVWNLYDSDEVFRGPFQTFTSLHQNYKVDYLMFNDEDSYLATLDKALAEGWGPDIFTIRGNTVISNKDKIEPIPSGVYGITAETFKSEYVPVASDQLIIPDTSGDTPVQQLYGIPLFVDSLAVYYNKRQFQDFIPTNPKPAGLWGEIINQVKALNQPDSSFERFARTGIALGRADNISMAPEILSLFFLQLGAPIYAKDFSSTLFAGYTMQDADSGNTYIPSQKALDFYTSFTRPSFDQYSWSDLITKKLSPPDEISAFATGKTSMIIGNAQTYQKIRDRIAQAHSGIISPDDIGISQIPQFSDKVRDTLAITYPLFVSKTSLNKDISFQLLAYLSDTSSVKNYLDTTQKPPARLDLVNEYAQRDPLGIFAVQAGFAKNYPVLDWKIYKSKLLEVVNSLVYQYTTTNTAARDLNDSFACVLGTMKRTPEILAAGCK